MIPLLTKEGLGVVDGFCFYEGGQGGFDPLLTKEGLGVVDGFCFYEGRRGMPPFL